MALSTRYITVGTGREYCQDVREPGMHEQVQGTLTTLTDDSMGRTP